MCNISRQLTALKEEKIALNFHFGEIISDQEGNLTFYTNVQEFKDGDGKQ